MNSLSEIQSKILIEGIDDYVGLWEVAWLLRQEDPSWTSEEIKKRCLEVLGPLLRVGYIKPGRLREDGGFVEWQLNPVESLSRIDREWQCLAPDPDFSQICWFNNTDDGDDAARAASTDQEMLDIS